MKPLAPSRLLAHAAGIDTVLRAAGAHNWSPEAIEAHKAHELAKAPPASKLWRWRHLIDWTVGGFAVVTCLAFFVLMIGVFGWLIGQGLAQLPSQMPVTAGIWTIDIATTVVQVSLLVGVASSMLGMPPLVIFDQKQVHGPACWEVVPMGPFFPVPAEATRMIAIVTALRPDADIKLHMLKQDDAVLDPVLEIDGHYVLVWDAEGTIIPPPV